MKIFLSLYPSNINANGIDIKKDIIVNIPNKFSGVIFLPLGLSNDNLEKTFLPANATLDNIAEIKDVHVNDNSDTEANETPNTIVNNYNPTEKVITSPNNNQLNPDVNIGSTAFTI
mgnify:CR=1 FL=1